MILHITLEPNIEKAIESVDIVDLGFDNEEDWNDLSDYLKNDILLEHFTDTIYGMVTKIEDQ